MAKHLEWQQMIHYDTNDTVSMADFYLMSIAGAKATNNAE